MSDESPAQNSLKKPAEEKKTKEGDSHAGDPSPIEPEVLSKLPPEVRRAVEFSLQSFSAPIFHPIVKKITEGHIDKVLDSTEKDSQREYRDRMAGRWFGLLYALIGAGLFVFVTIYLAGQDKELYRDILTKVIIFFGGGGLGYGVKAFLDRE